MRTFITAVILVVLLACGRTPAAAGGIRGSVTAGPTCPVEQVGSPCPPATWTGTVRATSSSGATFETTTDSEGAFDLRLPDGTYTVMPVSTGPGGAQPVTVTVRDDMQTVDLLVDTGIR